MSRFGFSSESDLFDAMRKVAPSKSEDLIKKLQKKQKQLQKREAKSHATADEEVLPDELIVQNPEEIVEEENEQAENDDFSIEEVAENTEQNEESTSNIPTLEQLLAQEMELSSIICGIEGEHKNLVAERRVLISKLENAQKALKELRRLLNMQEENITQVYGKFMECASKMEKLNEEKKSYTKQLDVIRKQIDNLRKVTIFVYENASFEVEKIPIEPITDSEVASQSMKLFALPEAEELTAKEIKNIAKLQVVAEMIEANGYKTELVFDSERVQKFWETVVA